MTISSLPLGYCTNVHPGRSLDEVCKGLETHAAQVAKRVGQPLGVGLWLSAPVAQELVNHPDQNDRLGAKLEELKLSCHTLNAFPFGDFHKERVKEQVYLPDWADPNRVAYTEACARILANLLPEGAEGSISTLPLGFKGIPRDPDFDDHAREHLISIARHLADLENETGRCIRLAIEPEPFCRIETTAEAVRFFLSLFEAADNFEVREEVHRYIGVCYDVCHQAVEFEDAGTCIRTLNAAGIRVNKVQISCAIEADNPAHNPEIRQALRPFVDQRYLHQTFGRAPDGTVSSAVDLTHELLDQPPDGLRAADTWRVHYHVPVDAERLGVLRTTRPELKAGLTAIAALPYAPHLEIETYTWNVLPGGGQVELADGLAAEVTATAALLESLDSR